MTTRDRLNAYTLRQLNAAAALLDADLAYNGESLEGDAYDAELLDTCEALDVDRSMRRSEKGRC